MEHTLKFGGNLKLICEDLRRIQRESDYQVVRRPPQLLTPKVVEPQPSKAMQEAFEIMSHSFDTCQPDLAARHNEHQP